MDIRKRNVGKDGKARNAALALQSQVVCCNARVFFLMVQLLERVVKLQAPPPPPPTPPHYSVINATPSPPPDNRHRHRQRQQQHDDLVVGKVPPPKLFSGKQHRLEG